jgi:hypothetical protein
VDASQFQGLNDDFCSTIYKILHPLSYPATGEVIDARGITARLTCAIGTSPWLQTTGYLNKPSTILLPAGTINIPHAWILPNNTHLIGEATNAPGSTGNLQTTIQTTSSSFTGPMIQFGDNNCPTAGCTGISVEQVTLNGSLATASGIVNQNSGAQSYVDHVNMYQLLGTGLLVSGSGAYDSGPYNNITFNVAGTPNSSTVCVQILNAGKTRGIHGLTCDSGTSDASAAILLDSSNNSIKDVRILGFHDGVLVGHSAAAQSNVLLNITGDTADGCFPTCLMTINVVHITNNTVSDLSILGVTNAGGAGTTTIQDDLTSTTLTDPSVAMYVLGESDSSGTLHSRFTTSQHAPSWTAGAGSPVTAASCAMGSLFSDSSGGALYVCTPGNVWAAVPHQP